MQRRVIRAIAFEHFTSSTTPLFSDLNILKLHDLFKLKLQLLYMIVLIRSLLLAFVPSLT